MSIINYFYHFLTILVICHFSFVREILSVSCEDAKLGLKMNGYVTNANYSVKKFLFLLFINRKFLMSK